MDESPNSIVYLSRHARWFGDVYNNQLSVFSIYSELIIPMVYIWLLYTIKYWNLWYLRVLCLKMGSNPRVKCMEHVWFGKNFGAPWHRIRKNTAPPFFPQHRYLWVPKMRFQHQNPAGFCVWHQVSGWPRILIDPFGDQCYPLVN